LDINDEDKNGFMLCIHKLDKSKGLDLFLHTPGGSGAATESLVHYLRQIFGNDIRAFVPQLAMSAGTIIACACKEIFMGKHSNLGPVDPQIKGLQRDSGRASKGRCLESNSIAVSCWIRSTMRLGNPNIKGNG
jgi:ClpP class serine protease